MPSFDTNRTAQQLSLEFARLLREMREKLALPDYKEAVASLVVTVSGDSAKFEVSLTCDYKNVHAATIGAAVDEYLRRAGFDDRQSATIDQSLNALMPPKDEGC